VKIPPSVPSALKDAARGAKDYSAAAGLLGGAVGALLYALLTLRSSTVYSPLGVSPSEVGLDYGTLLVRAAIGFIALFGVAIVGLISALVVLSFVEDVATATGRVRALLLWSVSLALVVAIGAWSFRTEAGFTWVEAIVVSAWLLLMAGFVKEYVSDDTSSPAEGATAPDQPSSSRWPLAVGAATLLLMFVAAVRISDAGQADAERLQSGERPRNLLGDIPPPWDAEVVRISWSRSRPPDPIGLPRCLLYLGQNDGVSVFYDPSPGHERSLRVPTSSLLIEVLPRTESALPTAGRSSC
jgi:hypothetical protein